VLNWLFPERVGKKYKARYCIPLNGEYVIDIDSYMAYFAHIHRYNKEWLICERCLSTTKFLTLHILEVLEKYYSKLAVVFSGRSGFHIHALDFNYHDWVSYRESDPIWCHHASRFKLTRLLQKQTPVFDKAHFNVSVDPMRVVTVPNSINAKTGLRCSYLGGKKDFEKLSLIKS
jgi:DNA primase catalytic subunit